MSSKALGDERAPSFVPSFFSPDLIPTMPVSGLRLCGFFRVRQFQDERHSSRTTRLNGACPAAGSAKPACLPSSRRRCCYQAVNECHDGRDGLSEQMNLSIGALVRCKEVYLLVNVSSELCTSSILVAKPIGSRTCEKPSSIPSPPFLRPRVG